MQSINKENMEKFMEKYYNFHDCNFISIDYDIQNQKIEVLMQLFWLNTENKNLERYTNTLKLVFKKIDECSIKEIESWDFILKAYLKYIEFKDLGERLCFASDEDNPLFYIICEEIEYEEVTISD